VTPRLELARVISDHDFTRKLRAAVAVKVCQERASCAELRARQKGRPTKARKPPPIFVEYTRVERAEAQNLVLQYLIDHCNWRTGEVGVWDRVAGRFVRPLSVKTIAGGCDLTIDRTERALSDLVVADLLWRFQHREREGDEWIGCVAFTRVTIKAFALLGLEGERQERIRKEQEEAAEAAERERRAARLAAADEERRRRAAEGEPFAHLAPTLQQQLGRRFLEIKHANKGWTHEQCEAAALEELGLAPAPVPDDFPD
jgi:hypothetical protein